MPHPGGRILSCDPFDNVSEEALQPNQCAERLKALSEPLRLRIVDVLRAGPKNVGELATALDVEMVTISHHLGILHHADLLEKERQGRFIVYRLRPEVFQPGNKGRAAEHLDLGCCRLELPKDQ